MSNSKMFTGRKTIYTDVKTIDRNNLLDVLRKALLAHEVNALEIDYLYRYWKGEQPIHQREKKIRPEINNTIVVNRANEIVAFKVGYVFGEPIQYVSRKGENSEGIGRINDIMSEIDKEAIDKEIAEWFSICGISYRMVLPNKKVSEDNPSPLSVYVLDPRSTFVVHSYSLGEPIVMGVKIVKTANQQVLYCVYTENKYYEVSDGVIIKEEPHSLGFVPIVEYYTSKAKLGEFEKVLDMLNAVNLTMSDRVNGIEQFVSSLMKFVNADISADDFEKLKDLGAIKIKSDSSNPADVAFMTQELNQTQIQVAIDDMYQTILTICGMPNRNGGTSTSDTGSAVALRDGWESAEARAKDVEVMFKRSERQFLTIALRILRDLTDINISLKDIDIKFTRRNYENITEKSNVLVAMLGCNKIHPRLAFEHSGMFNDVESAYKMSEEYAQAQEKKLEELKPKEPIEPGGNPNGSDNPE